MEPVITAVSSQNEAVCYYGCLIRRHEASLNVATKLLRRSEEEEEEEEEPNMAHFIPAAIKASEPKGLDATYKCD